MTAFCIFTGLVAAAALLLWGVDLWFWLWDRYCRFHIGRWPSEAQWREAVLRRAIRWTKRTPTVKITDNSRYILLDKLQGKYRSRTIQSWQTASLILGLRHMDTPDVAAAAEQTVRKQLRPDGMFVHAPTNIDCGMLAYAILHASDREAVRPAMDYAAELIRKHVGADGTVVYTNDLRSDERYVDTIGLACPFLAAYAAAYGKPEYAELAVRQLRAFAEHGLEPASLLPNHAYSVASGLPLGVYGWGRGVGWYTLGLIDTCRELPEGTDRDWLTAQIRTAAEQYRQYQRADGGFGHIFQLEKGYDSSATAAMAYFYRECARLFDHPDYDRIADRCLAKLRAVTRISGAIDWCQGDTKGIGTFALTYDRMPFAQGLALRAMPSLPPE